jgi:hypothetical protein
VLGPQKDKWLIREITPTEMHKYQNDKGSSVKTLKAQENKSFLKLGVKLYLLY